MSKQKVVGFQDTMNELSRIIRARLAYKIALFTERDLGVILTTLDSDIGNELAQWVTVRVVDGVPLETAIVDVAQKYAAMTK